MGALTQWMDLSPHYRPQYIPEYPRRAWVERLASMTASTADEDNLYDFLLLSALEAEEVQDGPSTGPSGDVAAVAATAATPSSSRRPLLGLLDLSEPCLLRILARLSPDDLLSTAQTCRLLQAAASDPAIWRALYAARWQQGPPDGEITLADAWKAAYVARDGAETAAEARRAPEETREMFVQMAAARRSEPLSAAAAATVGPVVGSDLAQRVAAFRRDRGLGTAAAGEGSNGAQKSAAPCPGGCRFVELDKNLWICEKGGHTHHCGDACSERHVDGSSEMLVCSITGRCFPRLMSEWEEGGGGGGGAEEDGGARDGELPGDDWNTVEGMGGRLGRAFFAGYNATDKEMEAQFGIKL